MSIIENVKEWFQSESARNKNSAILSGFLFFAGWWVLIDLLAVNRQAVNTGEAFIGVFGTISFFMVNTVKNSHLSEDNGSVSRARAAKLWLLIGFVIGFSSIVAAVWVMAADIHSQSKRGHMPGIAILAETVLIFIANLVYKFGRNEDDWGY